MENNTKKFPKLLLILVAGWAFLWVLQNLLAGSWFPRLFNHFLFDLITIVGVLSGIVILIPSIVIG